MASTLKIAIPLLLMVVVIFGVSFFSRYTEAPEEESKKKQQSSGSPLRFFSSTRRWDPIGGSLPDRAFYGSYEPSEVNPQIAHFWFENRNSSPVTMQLRGVSCSACSGGRLAPIPKPAIKLLFQMAAMGGLPQGLLAGGPIGMSGAAAYLYANLEWQSHEFRQETAIIQYTVPGAKDDANGWSPQWGILELNFKVRNPSKSPLKAFFVSQIEGTEQIGADTFQIFFDVASPIEVDNQGIDAGELNENSEGQSHFITIYSPTRDAAYLSQLIFRVEMPPGVGGQPGPYVSVGSPKALSEDETLLFAMGLSNKAGKPIRVKSAIRLPVTINSRDGNTRIDIGRLERSIWIVKGEEQKQVAVKGVVRGPVRLSEGSEINLGSFATESGAIERVGVTIERVGIDLKFIPEATKPEYLQVSLEKQPDRGGRGYYQMRVQVPKNKQIGDIRDGVIALELSGPNPQKVLFPIRGRGTSR